MIPQNLFSARKKAPQKMAHPVPSYMVVTPREQLAAVKEFFHLRATISFTQALEMIVDWKV